LQRLLASSHVTEAPPPPLRQQQRTEQDFYIHFSLLATSVRRNTQPCFGQVQDKLEIVCITKAFFVFLVYTYWVVMLSRLHFTAYFYQCFCTPYETWFMLLLCPSGSSHCSILAIFNSKSTTTKTGAVDSLVFSV